MKWSGISGWLIAFRKERREVGRKIEEARFLVLLVVIVPARGICVLGERVGSRE